MCIRDSIIADAISESNFEYIGAPSPAGIPFALISIIAPHDEPAFLILNSIFPKFLTLIYLGKKMDF